MRIIISHDIDHWRWTDHLRPDLFLPKHIARTLYYGFTRTISARTVLHRFEWLWRSQQHRLDELLELNRVYDVPATFFVGVANGLGLSYSSTASEEIVIWLRERGCNSLGLHGIAYNDPARIREERKRFCRILGHDRFGVRMHYLRSNECMLPMLSEAGFLFDSTTYGVRAPFAVEGMVEFPVGIMDVRVLSPGRNDLAAAKRKTIQRLSDAEASGVGLITVNFHDFHFSPAFPDHRDWYTWLLEWLRDRGHTLIDFESAIQEMGLERH